MYWYNTSTKNTIPSPGRGAAAGEMAGRGNYSKIVQQGTPTSTFPREGIAHASALLLIVLLIALFPGCKPDSITDATPRYFDLKGYFRADSARLARLNRITIKTVTHNGIIETKKVHINNWGLELSLFSESDINKPAWKDSYTIQGDSNTIIYRAKDPELKTQLITITKRDNQIKWIRIFNTTKNILYQTTEKLSYFPDSIYIIVKSQHVKLLGTNLYTIKGSLN